MRAEEVELSIPDGRSVRMLVNATPIRSAGGPVETVVVTMQDLAPLEELERERAEFWGMVSHELRAPLAAVKGSAATVLDARRTLDAVEVRQFFRIVNEQADRMDGLIGDLLDAGRIAAGTLSVEPAPVELSNLVERARRTLESSGARHAVQVDLPQDLPPVMADPGRIVQVLDNILANAARHSPDTAPIQVSAEQEGGHVAIAVTDGGEGIAPGQLARLFRKHGGEGGRTGMGLIVCRGLVEAHGGRIRAESRGPGRGARFVFTLPAAGGVDEAGPGAPATPGRRERSRVLVVDDDPRSLHYARDALTEAGYAPTVTSEPGEVAELIRKTKPSLVLLDLVLPGTDGLTLMQNLPELADLPVIFVSAYGRGDTVAQALEAGAADYIVKPFSPAELAARVRAALRRRYGAEPFVLGDLTIDYRQRSASISGNDVALTVAEFEALRVLSLHAGSPMSYDSLTRLALGKQGTGDSSPVRSLVKRLRAKLGDDASRPTYILNQRGHGYRMPSPEE